MLCSYRLVYHSKDRELLKRQLSKVQDELSLNDLDWYYENEVVEVSEGHLVPGNSSTYLMIHSEDRDTVYKQLLTENIGLLALHPTT